MIIQTTIEGGSQHVCNHREADEARPRHQQNGSDCAGPAFVFTYRDLGVTEATQGAMRAQITEAITGMTEPTGWHYHVCESQFVYILKGWVDLEFETGEKIRVQAGESVFIPGGLRHNEIRTSNDIELLEISTPAQMETVPCDPPAEVTA